MKSKSASRLALVDSCGWLEYVTGGSNADFFEAALMDTASLIVPAMCLYEVGKKMMRDQGEAAALEVLEMMQKSRVVTLAQEDYFSAAKVSITHKLAMADALIWQTAHSFGAALYTQDQGLQAMLGVKYQAKNQ